jgi:hypothetical protein
MGLKEIARRLRPAYDFKIDMPVIFRWCPKHYRFEWYDPCNRVGGVAPDLDSLRRILDRTFKCGQCGGYHVYEIYDADKQQMLDFYHFITGKV